MEKTDHRAAPRPGGRSARVRVAVLDAAFDILHRLGFEALTITGVAQASGVHETTIYRHWKTPAALAFEATMQFAVTAVGTPDTGSLKGDLVALVQNVASAMESPAGRALLEVCKLNVPELVETRRRFWNERLKAATTIFNHAVERGEIADASDAGMIVEVLVAPLYLRALVTGEPLTDWPVEKLMDQLTVAATLPSPRKRRVQP